jgi:hypothetical protein
MFLLNYLLIFKYSITHKPYSMNYPEFKTVLSQSNLTLKQFCQESGANYGAMANCGSNGRNMPPWVESWLKNRSQAQHYQALKRALDQK